MNSSYEQLEALKKYSERYIIDNFLTSEDIAKAKSLMGVYTEKELKKAITNNGEIMQTNTLEQIRLAILYHKIIRTGGKTQTAWEKEALFGMLKSILD